MELGMLLFSRRVHVGVFVRSDDNPQCGVGQHRMRHRPPLCLPAQPAVSSSLLAPLHSTEQYSLRTSLHDTKHVQHGNNRHMHTQHMHIHTPTGAHAYLHDPAILRRSPTLKQPGCSGQGTTSAARLIGRLIITITENARWCLAYSILGMLGLYSWGGLQEAEEGPDDWLASRPPMCAD